MNILWYLAVPSITVIAYCVVTWLRSRTPTSLQSGVDSFHREMRALTPADDEVEVIEPSPPSRKPVSRRVEPAARKD